MDDQMDVKNGLAPYLSAVPVELTEIWNSLRLLPGESRAELDIIRQIMVDEVHPESNLEWLWLLDLVELSWEILRYRRLKQVVLEAFRGDAIEAILLRLDCAGIPDQASNEVRLHVRRNVEDWRSDPRATAAIEARLRKQGFGNAEINAEIYCRTETAFRIFDGLMQSAQTRRIILLREISGRRESKHRIEKLITASFDARQARNRRGRV